MLARRMVRVGGAGDRYAWWPGRVAAAALLPWFYTAGRQTPRPPVWPRPAPPVAAGDDGRHVPLLLQDASQLAGSHAARDERVDAPLNKRLLHGGHTERRCASHAGGWVGVGWPA